MLQRARSFRGRPFNAPAAFIHPCQPGEAFLAIRPTYLISRAVHIALNRRRSDRRFPPAYFPDSYVGSG